MSDDAIVGLMRIRTLLNDQGGHIIDIAVAEIERLRTEVKLVCAANTRIGDEIERLRALRAESVELRARLERRQ